MPTGPLLFLYLLVRTVVEVNNPPAVLSPGGEDSPGAGDGSPLRVLAWGVSWIRRVTEELDATEQANISSSSRRS